jgi:hypothetical protein
MAFRRGAVGGRMGMQSMTTDFINSGRWRRQSVFARVLEAFEGLMGLLSSVKLISPRLKSEEAHGSLEARARGCSGLNGVKLPSPSAPCDLLSCRRYCRTATATEARLKMILIIARTMVNVDESWPAAESDPVA